MTDPAMSPAAQAVLAAFNDRHELCGPFDDNWQELCLAAALRAAADEVVPERKPPATPDFPDHNDIEPFHRWRADQDTRAALLAIAAELEAQP